MSKSSQVPLTAVRRVEADGVNVFYREAGPADAPVVLLLHGFPTSSFQYRELIPLLADKYRVIAPDLPGFGFTEVPKKRQYKYTFDALAKTIIAFTDALGLKRYALYVFDYGAPTGFRLAMAHPERVTAIVSQMYGPPPDCKGKGKGRSTDLRKCIRPLGGEQSLLAMMSCAACSS